MRVEFFESNASVVAAATARTSPSRRVGGFASQETYPTWFFVPAAIIYGVLFLVPTLASFFFSLTRWTLSDATYIGLDNFRQFFREPFLVKGLINTLIYGGVTSGLKVVLGLLLAVLLTSDIIGRGYLRAVVFFPVLVSTVGVGITFTVMMHPTTGVINETLQLVRHQGAGLAYRSPLRLDVGRAGRRLERRRAGDGDLHCRHRLDSAGLLRGRHPRRRQRHARCSATSPCRSCARRRSR